MTFSQSKDFVTKNGLITEGTSSVTSSTGNVNAIQSDGGIAAAKNLIVGTTATIYGPIETFSTASVLDLLVKDVFVSGTIYGKVAQVVNTATNLALGSTGQIPFQKNPSITGFFGPGQTGTVLVSQGQSNTGPVFQNTLTLSGITDSSSTQTGAFQVLGGAGIGGRLFATEIHTPIGFNTLPTLYDISGNKIHANSAINIGTQSGGAIYFGDEITPAVISGSPTIYGHISAYFNNDLINYQLFYGTKDGLVIGNGTTPTAKIDIRGDAVISGITTITNVTNSTSSFTGALIVFGGVAIQKELRVTEKIYGISTGSDFASRSFTATNIDGGEIGSIPIQTTYGNTTFIPLGPNGYVLTASYNTASWIASSNIASGLAITATNLAAGSPGQIPFQYNVGQTNFFGPGTSGNVLISQGNVATGPIFSNTLTLSGTIESNGTDTGALRVFGGVGIAKNLYVGGNSEILGNIKNNSTLSSIFTASDNSLYIKGGAWIGKTLVVEDTAFFHNGITVNGTATNVYSTNTVYTDNLLQLHVWPNDTLPNNLWEYDDGKDIGLIFNYYKSNNKNAFLGLNNSSQYLEWYSNGNESQGFFTATEYGTFRTGAIKLVGGQANTGNTSTGDLQVLGGVGIHNNLFVEGTTVLGKIASSSMIEAYSSNNHQVVSFTSNPITNSIQTVLDSFSVSTYRTAKYLIQIVDQNFIHAQEILITHMNGFVYKTEYDIISNDNELGTFDADISNGACRLLFKAISPTSLVVKIHRTTLSL
jgi:hypothetical protein